MWQWLTASEKRPRWALPLMAVALLTAVLATILPIVVGARRDASPMAPPPAASTARSGTPAAAVAVPAASAASTEPDAARACVRAGEPRVIAPSATLGGGLEVRAFGSDVAIGFAPSDRHAMLVRLDPESLSVVESTVAPSAAPVRRVTPIPGKKGRLGLAVDADRKGDPLRGRRTLPVDPPVQLGVANGYLAWAPIHRGPAGKLWPIDRTDGVEALRGARSESNLAEVAIAFRHAGAVWVGAIEGSGKFAPNGGLSRIAGLGPLVGPPAVAVNEGVALVSWADRSSPDDKWLLRTVRFRVGEAPGEATTFAAPAGASSDEATSPSITVVPGGRFLLVWTQGPPNVGEVRAWTLSPEGKPVGVPFTTSSAGAKAGQGQAAVTANGRGLVAFLQASATGFEVAVTPIHCAP